VSSTEKLVYDIRIIDIDKEKGEKRMFQGKWCILQGGLLCRANLIPASWDRSGKESSA
jgi:hypothetical protein